MEIKQYQEIINKTAIYPQSVNDFGKAYVYLGLMGEWNEMVSAYSSHYYTFSKLKVNNDLEKEMGDVVWYICAASLEFNLNFSRFIDIIKTTTERNFTSTEECLDDCMSVNLSVISEDMKKYFRDGKKDIYSSIETIIEHLCILMSEICYWEGIDIHNVLKMNYDKLILRRKTNTVKGDGDNREIKN